MRTQEQHFYAAQRINADINTAFLEMANHPTAPLTESELTVLIAKRPALWGRFAGWFNK